jgi:hypothetical protein
MRRLVPEHEQCWLVLQGSFRFAGGATGVLGKSAIDLRCGICRSMPGQGTSDRLLADLAKGCVRQVTHRPCARASIVQTVPLLINARDDSDMRPVLAGV